MLVPLVFPLLWPLAELFVVIEVARAIGVLATLGLLIIAWPLGMWAIRTQGAAAWRRLAATVAERRPAGRELLDGTLVLLGGLLLLVPGFITDALGLFLLLPPTRATVRPVLARNLDHRLFARAARYTRRPGDVDSTAHDIDQPRLGR